MSPQEALCEWGRDCLLSGHKVARSAQQQTGGLGWRLEPTPGSFWGVPTSPGPLAPNCRLDQAQLKTGHGLRPQNPAVQGQGRPMEPVRG